MLNIYESFTLFGKPLTKLDHSRGRGCIFRYECKPADFDPAAVAPATLDDVRKGDEIHGLDAAAKMPGKIFHAGTMLNDAGKVVTNGGRVVCAVGLGTTVRAAQKQAYELAGAVCWEGLQYRKDIGYRAIDRKK